MSDALVSPAVAVSGGIIATAFIIIASRKVKHIRRSDLIPLMGVLGAFVFAAQMINFSIPGTGSSGHLIGGLLLSAILGPWAAFLTLCSVLIVQCLIFADGGLLALGCNIVNMAVTSCLIGYPFIYRPIVGHSLKPWRIILGSITASMVALEIGALAVVIETELSGITALPFGTFFAFMLPIHLVIAFFEGLATAAVIIFVANYKPGVLMNQQKEGDNANSGKKLIAFFLSIALIFALGFTWLASSNPDGLEWSIEKVSGLTELPSMTPVTALMPDYESSLSGIVGSVIVMVLIWGFTSLLFSRLRKKTV